MPNSIRLPKGWPSFVRSAVLHIVSLAHHCLIYSRSWCADSPLERVRLKAKLTKVTNDLELYKEVSRILRSRLLKISAKKRPNYSPIDRMSILEVKAAFSLSKVQTARMFLLKPDTISSWMRRLDEDGESALVQMSEPVNRFPNFVKYLVKRLKILCPNMGKVRIAQSLARAGLHIGVTTVGRMLKDKIKPSDSQFQKENVLQEFSTSKRTVTAKYSDHVWNLDLTAVPTAAGFWLPWLPFSRLQFWPFCWWVLAIVDHFSRSIVVTKAFKYPPTKVAVCSLIKKTINAIGKKPKYTVTDKGTQFMSRYFKRWCKNTDITPRFGAIGKHGSIALIERFFRSLKSEFTRLISIPLKMSEMEKELEDHKAWFNVYRPHQTHMGKTPNEVRQVLTPAIELPRFEPRNNYPSNGFCASPQTRVRGSPGVKLELSVSYYNNNKRLPIVELKAA